MAHRVKMDGVGTRRNRARRRGFVTLYLALALVVLMGVSALVVDLGIDYQMRSYMQKAADASALEGAAYAVQNPSASVAQIQNAAATFAASNYGYTNGASQTTLATTVTPDLTRPLGNGRVRVDITRPQPTLFARIFALNGANFSSTGIGATATSVYKTVNDVGLNIAGTSAGYGVNDPTLSPVNISLLGPLAVTSRGDQFGARYDSANKDNNSKLSFSPWWKTAVLRPQDDRATDHPTYAPGEDKTFGPEGDGYYFDFSLPQSPGPVTVQLYDPGSYTEAVDPASGKFWNEINFSSSTMGSDGKMRTVPVKTRFQVWCDMGHPDEIGLHQRVDSHLYGNDPNDSLKWDNFTTFDPANYPPGAHFYMNATTVDGTGKNGFNIRLAKAGDTDKTFLPVAQGGQGGNGTGVTARGSIPINFGSSGTAVLALGSVPKGATSMSVTRFDTDVGTHNGDYITYTDITNNITINGPPGKGGTDANDVGQTDPIALPANYPGGTWTATYKAAGHDESTWSMVYAGPSGDSRSTSIALVD